MRRSLILFTCLASASLASPALALDRYGVVSAGSRFNAVDPDERLERLAAASTPAGSGHAKPPKSVRNILRDDPYLQAAFASLDNR